MNLRKQPLPLLKNESDMNNKKERQESKSAGKIKKEERKNAEKTG
jgi:hypothetical protein